jgi:hypothetical protein
LEGDEYFMDADDEDKLAGDALADRDACCMSCSQWISEAFILILRMIMLLLVWMLRVTVVECLSVVLWRCSKPDCCCCCGCCCLSGEIDDNDDVTDVVDNKEGATVGSNLESCRC